MGEYRYFVTVTTMIYNDNISNDDDLWSINYLIDAIKLRLATIEITITNEKKSYNNDKKIVDSRKYYDLAYRMLKIGVFRPAPSYDISLRDLTPKIIWELYHLDMHDRRYVLKHAVGRIFEDVNPDIYHYSVSGVLKVQLVK